MKNTPRIQRPLAATLLAAMLAAGPSSFAQNTGFNQSAGGTYSYTDTNNWVDGNINGIWDAGLSVAGGQIIQFTGDTILGTGLTFRENSGQNKTFSATGGAATLTLGGDIIVAPLSGNATYTIGSTTGASNLNVNLGGAVRTLTVTGGGNGGTFGKTLNFVNVVSNGGIIASGGGTGGGKIQLSGLTSTLSSAEIRDAELSFNGSGNNSANSAYTITGALTGGGGASTVTALARTASTTRNTLVSAGSFVRNGGSTILFRGTNLGTQTIASATAGVANISFSTAPTLSGGGGGSGSTTIGIIAGAFGDTSATGSGFGATGGLVTYDAANGVRLLSASEYKTSITDGQTQLDNIKLSNSSGAIATTTLTSATTTINSLSLEVSGATGNQGITVTGDPATTLKINSGVIYAYQNVTGGTNTASTDAITLSVPTIDFNGQEGIILANTRMNTSGGISNGGLIINSTLTNANGLTIGDGLATNSSGYVFLGGSSANTYSGATTINGAAVRLGKSVTNTFNDIVLNLGSVFNSGNQLADTANVTINGGVLYMNSTSNSGSATSDTFNNLTMTGGTISPGSGSGNTITIAGTASLSGGSINMAQNAKLNIAGTTTLSGGVISVGNSNSASVYNSKTSLGAVNITNTAVGTSAYTPITIAAGGSAGLRGGQVELSGDLTFTGNSNTNTVTIAAPTGTGLQGVMALNGARTFNIGNGAATVDLTVNAPLINGTATGGLIKSGLGTLALTGVNTYTGATVVNQGTLALSGSGALAADSALTVAAGASFDTSAQAGYTFNTAVSTTVGFNGSNAGLIKAATATFTNAALVLDFGSLTDLAASYDVFDISGATTGNFASVTATGTTINGSFVNEGAGVWTLTSGDLSITFNAYDGVLSSIPEPAAFGLLAGAGFLGFAALRRKRRNS